MAVSNEEIALAVEKYLKSGSGRAVAEKRLWGELAGLFRIVVDNPAILLPCNDLPVLQSPHTLHESPLF